MNFRETIFITIKEVLSELHFQLLLVDTMERNSW